LCTACRARLRGLLCARAGVRRSVDRSAVWPVGLAMLALVLLTAGLLRHASVSVESVSPGQGVWSIVAKAPFTSPVGLAEDRAGNLYVVDAANHRIIKMAPDGSVLAMFGSHGTGPGEFERPSAIALDPIGNLY